MIPGRSIKVGVTGGIGSGKSTVCRVFSMLGVPVYDSDSRARELMNSDPALVYAIKQAFGGNAYLGGRLDRSYLAGKVFSDSSALKKLDSIVHPAVMRDFDTWASRQETPYVILESAIIFEAGLRGRLDRVVTVSAPEELRVERVMARDGSDREQIRARMANQMTDPEREGQADYVIRNDEKSLVWEQVLELDAVFRRE